MKGLAGEPSAGKSAGKCAPPPGYSSRRATVGSTREARRAGTMQAARATANVDRSVIALWLGHECVETTQIYLEATLAMKE